MFEIVIQKMVDRWSGSIEAGEEQAVTRDPRAPALPSYRLGNLTITSWGLRSSPPPHFMLSLTSGISPGVTAIRPDDLEFPNTMTDIDYDTWMLR